MYQKPVIAGLTRNPQIASGAVLGGCGSSPQ